MPSVAIREFSNADTLTRTLAKRSHSTLKYKDPLKILLKLEDDALQEYDPRLPASKTAFVRAYINSRLNNLTR